VHVVIDSSGLKLPGRGGWDEEKHGRARRSWGKSHITVDAGADEIVACVPTDDAEDDAGRVPALLGQIEGEIASVAADAACDGEPAYQAIVGPQPEPTADIVIPPRASAVPSTRGAGAQQGPHIRLPRYRLGSLSLP
jgi:hypothetical protein